jgi:hypothetical protein
MTKSAIDRKMEAADFAFNTALTQFSFFQNEIGCIWQGFLQRLEKRYG